MRYKITKNQLPSHLKERSEQVKTAFVDTVNSCIDKGLNYSLSVKEANKVIEKIEQEELEQKKKDQEKQQQIIKQNIHKSILEKPINFPKLNTATEEFPKEPSFADDIKQIFFDSLGKLHIIFDDDSKAISSNATPADYIEQHVAVQVNPVFDYIRFNTEVTETSTLPHEEGLLFYDKESHSLSYYNDDTSVVLNIGQEKLIRVYNAENYPLLDGKVVWISGASSGWPTASYASAADKEQSYSVLGIVTADIQANSYGYVCISGRVNNIDTSAYDAGAVLYLSTILGEFTDVAPVQPNYVVTVGKTLNSQVNGALYVVVDRREWFPNLNLLDFDGTTLPTVPTPIKPATVNRNHGFNYDSVTGSITFLESGNYTLTLSFNATPSASNKNIYFYSEELINGVWTPNRYTARKVTLENQVETQVQITAARYVPTGTSFRFNVWGDSTVTLQSTNLPGTTPGTVTIPSVRLTLA